MSVKLPALIDRRGLQHELGVTSHAAEQIMRQLPTVRPGGLRKVYVRRADIARYLEEATVANSVVEPVRASVSVWIRARRYTTGRTSYIVLYRRGGRATKPGSAGTFPTRRHANMRADLVRGWLALGLDPQAELRKLVHPEKQRTLADWFGDFIASRIDVVPATLAGYRNGRDRILPVLGDIPVADLKAAHVQAWISRCSDLAPGTVHGYLSVLRMVLDHADVEPNPARSAKIRKPRDTGEEPRPPTTAEWRLILQQLDGEDLAVLRLIECLGLRVAEACGLLERDIDRDAGRLRVSKARTKGRTQGQRWLPFPAELLDGVGGRGPDRRLFTVASERVRRSLRVACREAGVEHYHPHDLRHRRVSLWVAHGFDLVTVRVWAGHSKLSTTSRYSHVIVEPHIDEWAGFWTTAYRAERAERPGLALAALGPDSSTEGGRDGDG